MRHKEKCKWPEVVGSVSESGLGSGDMKGKGKAVAMSPRAGEKKKHVKKSATKVVNSDVEIVAKPSDGSGHALLQRMDRLILTVENLAEAQWYTASACAASGMAVGTLVNECNFLGFKGMGRGRRMKRRRRTRRRSTRRRLKGGRRAPEGSPGALAFRR